jgi:hypothetical protein
MKKLRIIFDDLKTRYKEMRVTRQEALYDFLRWGEQVFKPEEGSVFLRHAVQKFVNEKLSDREGKANFLNLLGFWR